MSDQEDAKLQMYLDEAKEQLEGVETDILQMEEQQGELDQELINKIFRNIHTVKGGAGFLGLTKLRDLSHIMEDLLDKVRNAEIKIEKDHINQLLESVDCLKQMLDAPKEDVDISAHLHNLTMLIERSLQQDDVDNSAGEIFDDVEVVMTSLDNDNEAIVSSDETESSAVYDDNASMGVPEWPQMFQLQNDQMEGWTEKGFSLFVISFNYSNDSRRAHIPRDQTIDDLNAIGYTLEKKINPHQLEEHV
ncbi:MAG: Hpt domain-containing protein, partial [Pseudomonadales bacterium]|nr:Hpt domain-containing protein [Pseudomonadales bacterium]